MVWRWERGWLREGVDAFCRYRTHFVQKVQNDEMCVGCLLLYVMWRGGRLLSDVLCYTMVVD